MRVLAGLLVLIVFGFNSNIAVAESDFLNAEQLKELYSGAVVEGKSGRGYSYRQNYEPDGTLNGEIIDSGKTYKAKWWIEADGQACTDTKRFGVRCRKVKHVGDVEYKLFTENGSTYTARFVNKGDLAEKFAK